MLALAPCLGGSADAQEYPLEPPVTSSPRETFQTFLTSQEQMWALIRDEGAGKRSGEGYNKLIELDARSKRTLDLSGVAPEARRETANDGVVYLYEVLTRVELPSLDEIPGDAELEGAIDLERWTVPHTEISVHRISEGAREGEYLFTPETVARAKEFYERTKHLPYRNPPPMENVGDFLETYGGWDVPVAWVDALPAPMRRIVGEQAIWKWFVLSGFVLLFAALVLGAYRLTHRFAEGPSARRYLWRLTSPVLLLAGSAFGFPVLSDTLLLRGDVAKYLNLSATAIGYLSLAWIAWILILAAGEVLVNRPRVRIESLDASLIRLTARLIAISAVVFLIFQGATAVGVPLVGLVASVSIGGLAVALAAQDTLKNLLGSLMIFIDQPYRVGERIIAGGHDGVVEQIGLRSTRIRQLDGNLTSIPNEKMATLDIENVERRRHIRRKTQLRIATGTPREKIEEALGIVKGVLENHEGMPAGQPPRVYFQEFNPDSLSIMVFYWYEPPHYWAFCEFGERINLEIVRRFAEAGIALAPPTTKMQVASEAAELLQSERSEPGSSRPG